ncbi:MAG: hypothetical protein DHS20C11_16310 [Lysobacteraceae bacterium]|nr:MAG: hypothetical protein DHS20C11_16310 [Xanthomonadaceae bacterium]
MTRFSTFLMLAIGIMTMVTTPSNAGQMQGYIADFINPATLSDVDADTAAVGIPPAYAGCAFAPPNVVFGVGFTSGLSYAGSALYGIEWDGVDIYLYSFDASGCAVGNRVGASPVGAANLESLAYCPIDGFFYSVDFDFAAPHLGQLVRIDPLTGIGTPIGSHMSPDVRIVGMVCDGNGLLWAVTSGFASRNPELLNVDRTTGVETLIGPLGLPANEVESLAVDPATPFSLFAAGKALYAVNAATGAASLVGGSYETVYAMAGTDLFFFGNFEP